jgi:hypothetical protein
MITRTRCCDPLATTLTRLLVGLTLLVPVAGYCEPTALPAPLSEDAAASVVYDWSPAVTLPARPLLSTDLPLVSLSGEALGNEMSSLAVVELARVDRRFRARVVDWFGERSRAAGLMSDLLVHGYDTGLHLKVKSGDYLVRWETRF